MISLPGSGMESAHKPCRPSCNDEARADMNMPIIQRGIMTLSNPMSFVHCLPLFPSSVSCHIILCSCKNSHPWYDHLLTSSSKRSISTATRFHLISVALDLLPRTGRKGESEAEPV